MSNNRLIWAKIIIIFVAVSSLFSFIALAYLVDDDLGHKTNLSRTSKNEQISGLPKIKTSGANIAVVWSDGFDNSVEEPNGSKERGHIFLKTARDGLNLANSEGYWRRKTYVYSATATSWGQSPNFTFDRSNENLVHIVWSESSNCTPGQIGDNCQFHKLQYRQCDIANDISVCTPNIGQAGDTIFNISSLGSSDPRSELSLFSPQIVQDDNDNLHVIWFENSTPKKVFYSRWDANTTVWSTPTEVVELPDEEAMSLFYNNGRLHFVYDSSGETVTYFYDEVLADNVVSVSGTQRTFRPFINNEDEIHTDPGNPVITGQGDWLFLAYDGQSTINNAEYSLYYVRSVNNGTSWSSVFKVQDGDSDGVIIRGETAASDQHLRLRPQFVMSSSATLTQVFAVWHEQISDNSGLSQGRVRLSQASFDEFLSTKRTWSTGEKITYPDETEALDEPTINPVIALTRLTDGTQTGQMVYQEKFNESINGVRPDQIQPLETYYQGSIAGTMDAEYVLDYFIGSDGKNGQAGSFKKVSPTHVRIVETSVVTDLNYTIAFTNKGDLNAIGFGFTDTLPDDTVLNESSLRTFINNVEVTGDGKATYNAGDKTINWYRDVIVPEMSIRVEYMLTTQDTLLIPAEVTNVLELWNQNIPAGGPKQRINITEVRSSIFASIVYLPTIRR
ncbi:MAG: hypothetical protein AAF629_11915 [Chloroflexota bacterium]